MSRNTEQRFTQLPQTFTERSKNQYNWNHKTSFNTGKLIPFYLEQDIIPGDTFAIKTACVVRLSTPKWPTMDIAYLDTYYFFVPNRIVCEHWQEQMGENKHGAWVAVTEYETPHIYTDMETTTLVEKGHIAEYMGVVPGINGYSFSALPIRGYIDIWNEWFRDQNLTAPIEFPTDDHDVEFDGTSLTGGECLNVYRFHDYFTSALPRPQKGDAVSLPLGTTAPLIFDTTNTSIYGFNVFNPSGAKHNGNYGATRIQASLLNPDNESAGGGGNAISNNVQAKPANLTMFADPNMYLVDLSMATAATINALRLATQTQKILEADARGGTRYTEILKMHFGVISPDARLQRPEYLGGKRIPINVQQVLQTSSTDETSPQGNTGAYSLTGDYDSGFVKSFTEHGMIIGLCCVRTNQSYQQGMERGWSRRRRLDYYWPKLAHLGEQPIYNKEIYTQGGITGIDDEVFGYQERWAEYRYKPNRISGELRSTYSAPLDAWHYGNKFDDLPILSTEFLQEPVDNMDRTLMINSKLSDQFIADFVLDITTIRPMPVYSIPGMMDHF